MQFHEGKLEDGIYMEIRFIHHKRHNESLTLLVF